MHSVEIKKMHGFTLLEIVIVLIILLIIGSILALFWPGKSIELRSQTEQLAQDIRYTQSLCVSRNARYRLVFNLSPPGYHLTNPQGNPIIHPAHPQSTTITFSSGIHYGLIQPPASYVTFNGRGIPYIFSTTEQKLTTTLLITLTDGAVTRTIQITPKTGYVLVT
ncbi:MAG: prepilin-type N-terminal cleavage/methylation domain-containing protein [Gammaproteobacteria bacterium]|nr:prepilin-type N-terminal cleavage/methylation domain-containing protein [Gammaproteobacteria bacterium]